MEYNASICAKESPALRALLGANFVYRVTRRLFSRMNRMFVFHFKPRFWEL